MLIVVEVDDHDGSSREKFLCALEKYSPQNITLQKLIYSFLDTLVGDDMKIIEDTGIIINKLEELVLKDKANENFNLQLLQLKKELHNIHNYYEQLVDISEALEDNENDIFDNEDLRYISNYTNKVIRMREDIRSLSSAVVHLQDAYSSFLELKLNHTMKVFTVITSIFFPLTVIVGWYGMNFQSMPEFTWKYGYLFVIVLSIFVVALLVIIVKKRKWI
jgi:magnesium transporter